MDGDGHGNSMFDTHVEAEYPFGLCIKYAEAVEFALREWSALSPAGISDRASWVQGKPMREATKWFANDDVFEASGRLSGNFWIL